MRKRATAIAALLALAALAVVAAASAKVDRAAAPSAASSADSRLIACGNTRTMGLLAPFTGPAASLGAQQIDWVKYYVATYNRAHKKGKLRLQNGDTVLGGPGGTAEAVKAVAVAWARTSSARSDRQAVTRSGPRRRR